MSLATNAGTAKYVSYREAQLDALTRAKRAKEADDFSAKLGLMMVAALAIGAFVVLVMP